MEAAEKLELNSNQEKEPHYNFKEIAELEPAMVSLVEKLKDKIEKNEYDTLISDEVGGRMPTLILREIMMEKGSYNKESKLNTFFITDGSMLTELDSEHTSEKVKDFLAGRKEKIKKALLVTEYIEKGGTIMKLDQILFEAGISNYDLATAYLQPYYSVKNLEKIRDKHEFFYGETIGHVPDIYKKNQEMAGVVKTEDAYPESRIKFILDQIAKAKPSQKEMVKTYKEKILPSVHRKLKSARQDAHTMAGRILDKVWG